MYFACGIPFGTQSEMPTHTTAWSLLVAASTSIHYRPIIQNTRRLLLLTIVASNSQALAL